MSRPGRSDQIVGGVIHLRNQVLEIEYGPASERRLNQVGIHKIASGSRPGTGRFPQKHQDARCEQRAGNAQPLPCRAESLDRFLAKSCPIDQVKHFAERRAGRLLVCARHSRWL